MSKFSTRDLTVSIKNKAIDKTIENLNISVVATKTLASVPNEAEIEIYNLNQNSREDLYNNVYNFHEDIGNTNITVTDDDKQIFTGQLINVNSTYSIQDAEWKTVLYCGDGFNAFRTKTNRKFDKGTSRKDMVDALIGELESAGVVVKGAIEGFTNCTDKSLLKAVLVNGEIVSNIKRLLKDCFKDVDVYVDEEKINILVEKSVIKNNLIVINSGLIEPPTLSEQGINAKVVLNSSLKIGAEFQVQSRSRNISFGNLTVNRPRKKQISGDGIYRVQELKHIVDNFSSGVATTEIIGLNSGRL